MYISDISKNKFSRKKILFTDGLKALIEGTEKLNNNEIKEELKNFDIEDKKRYRDLIKFTNIKTTNYSNYYKIILEDIKKHLDLEAIGNGLNYSNNKKPLFLFVQLRKLLSAKKAGHDNLNESILKILNKLKKKKYIKDKNHEKIILKYNL